ncbi:MAG: SVM family protein [Phytoplasma sp.]|uniref:SVM family protein n=1 Tax=Phytoplasma sp. TaxID=2155 RepID=UPI002B417E9D|nr:SVM family protein [Phytoplasma sp.]WRH06838.1 MAG: SVM family protein [Phytoplasma sp.]
MFKFKKQFKIIYFYFIIFIGLLFIFNNNQLIAMQNIQNKLKIDLDIAEEAVDKLIQSTEYFNKKGMQINLNKITKLLSKDDKRKQKTVDEYINSKNNKKAKK